MSRRARLFADAKPAEDAVQDFVGVDCTDHLAQLVEREPNHTLTAAGAWSGGDAPVSDEMRSISRGSLIFSTNTAGIFATLIRVMISAIARALGSESVETPKGAMNSTS